jgi:hypothetical protein
LAVWLCFGDDPAPAKERAPTENVADDDVLRVAPPFDWSQVVQRSLFAVLVIVAVLNLFTPWALLLTSSPSPAIPRPLATSQPILPMTQTTSTVAVDADAEAAPTSFGPLDAEPSVAAAAPANLASLADAVTANVSELVRQMWGDGLLHLARSSCHEAERLFAGALAIVDSNTDLNGTMVEDRRALVSDRAFALVCATRFQDAATYIEEQFSNITATHVLNAAGYAHFKIKNYARAGDLFQSALKADPLNKIMWSNLAAAKLLAGDIQAADDAMYYATDPSNTHFHSDEWFNRVFFTNVKVLLNHAMGQKAEAPIVELWYDQISAR